jgi:cyclic beta-1,2-glucan synthetase
MPPSSPRNTASWRAGLLSRPRSDAHEFPAAPIRGELLGPDKLANRARSLARSQKLLPRPKGWRGAPLLRRLEETDGIIERAHIRLTAAAAKGVDVGPAAEWLLDNMYVVQEHMREVRESLPKGYYRELPVLANGHLAGYPRVYEIATTLIAHTEGRVDLEDIERFVAEFQEHAFLTLGELWAVPAMLRLGLIENVRRMTLRAVQGLDQTEEADRWARRIHSAAGVGGELLGAALNDFVASHPPLTAIFVTRFLQQMRLEGGGFTPLTWLQQWLAEDGMSAELAATQSRQRAALTQVGMANSITSLRAVALQDWKGFVERLSVTDAALRDDPSGFYSRMTFATRDNYRHVVEGMAKRTRLAEEDIAGHAVELARESVERKGGVTTDRVALRTSHVGYYLVDEGREELERAISFRPKLSERIYRALIGIPNIVFFGGIAAGTVATLALVLAAAQPAGAWLLFALISFIPATAVAVSLVNLLITSWLPPRLLPRLEFGEPPELPEEYCTAVVVPTLFDDVQDVTQALEHLEAQFLANRAPRLYFAILSDVADAPAETLPQDDAIVAAAMQGIAQLNERYADGRSGGDIFFLFHRPRKWNPREGVWMGWERKRGKLADFNRFLESGERSAWSVITGGPSTIQRAKYVLTIDADTVLPPDAALRLVGTIAHPLNQAVYDPERARVVKGYGIIQPRVNVLLPSAFRSRFAAIHSGHPGVDPYTTAVSDAYQDLYGEGSFTGKGIYEVEIFERATRGRFPANTLLSHDLIEGNYARAALATDIELYDEYPSRYLSFVRRKVRWTRGDWQLLPWLGPRVPGPDGLERNRLSLLSRWKIADNMRRSFVEITQLLMLVVGWTLMPTAASAWRWSLVGLATIAAPWVFSFLVAVVRPPLDKSWRAYYRAVGEDTKSSALQLVLALAFLAHQAWSSVDAIVRTLWRLFVSRRHLLQWRTALQTEQGTSSSAGAAWRAMWPAAAIAVVALLLAYHRAPAVPFVVLWMFSPAIATALNAPPIRRRRPLTRAQRASTLRYALLHWRFFERFVTADTQWLAPDNYQEEPDGVVAMRTSPTNIGLQLMSTVSAYDLGFITLDTMVMRLEEAFKSLERMRRLHGHFYNWYDLHDLQVLQPPYISTVDSGNLSGHLLALAQACWQLCGHPAVSGDARTRDALYAAASMAAERLREIPLVEQGLDSGLATAKDELRLACRALGAETTSATWLADAVGALEHAHAAFVAVATPSAPVDEASDLVGWSLARAAAHRDDAALSTPTIARLKRIAEQARDYATSMDFRFLLDEKRKLFSIGYSEGSHSYDASSYDLLASEARLASLIAIAKNDAPPEHWFRLGRTLVHAAGETALVSWSGSMFEYLMPLLVVRSFPDTVMDQSYHGSVRRQIAYGSEHGVPWGVSESAYNVRDRHLTYQYRAFGVPDLALKRGLARDLVVAPYATALAMMVDPVTALDNLALIAGQGMLGPYGFRDAMDFTRPNPGQRFAPVRTFMAHHVGMSLIAFTNALTDHVWQKRFHSEALVRSVELLLHERIPRRLVFREPPATSVDEALPNPESERPAVREMDTPHTPQPVIALLGSLPYTIMVSNSGAGYSRYEQLAVTRWRADGTRDDTGQFCYVRDVASGKVWSAAHQPVCAPADYYRVLFATDRVTTTRVDAGIETRTEIAVVTGDAAEVRRVTVTNQGDAARDIELTSYGEIVLGSPDADRAHPAFANLFVETEWHEWCSAVTATRRPRSSTEQPLWLVHVVDSGRERVGPVSCETDRAQFIGRGRSRRNPLALDRDGPLSGTTGAVLDPVFALRTRIHLEPGQCETVAFTTIVATSRERAFELADRYHHPHAAQRALDMAWTGAQIELRELNITPAETAVYQELAGHLLYADPAVRVPADEISRNQGSQPLLWAIGVSGDWPILLATVETSDGLPTVRQLLAAHHYWRRRGLRVDLVILNASPTSYLADLNDKITELVLGSSETGEMDRPGGIFVRRRELLDEATLLMLRGTARVNIECDGRAIGKILTALTAPVDEDDAGDDEYVVASRLLPPRSAGRATPAAVRIFRRIREVITDDGLPEETDTPPHADASAGTPGEMSHSFAQSSAELAIALDARPPLAADNGFGGLTESGAYEIRLRDGRLPPAAWANVIATPNVGFLVTERGGGCTWVENSQFFRLTPWQNDPVSDPPSEMIYLRDDESGEIWSATAAPVAHNTPYYVRHDAGITTCEHEHVGIATHLSLGVTEQETVKLSVLRITNGSTSRRRISVTSYLEWTLGVLREHTQHQVHTSFAPEQGAVLARNTFDPTFAEWVAFSSVSAPVTSYTADRREFLGRNGTLEDPAGMRAESLGGATGPSLDPCAALRCVLELAPGETREIVVSLGAARSDAAARELAARYRDVALGKSELTKSVAAWNRRLSVVRVKTPDPLFDTLVNRWSLYQALACRMWARTALYQSSGAYGFRDQLQDVMAFVYAEPGVAREHILRAASRQFVEGDVQHWWHEPSGRGVRTRFSDDLVWLPYVVHQYVAVTGDTGILDEQVPFLTMRVLAPHEEEVYDLPQVTEERATVYEHCLRALRKASTSGAHALPLMGTGDWNDGMNRVGVEGRGESVWLAWFLISTLRSFAEHVEARGEAAAASELRAHADGYSAAAEVNAWDGEWYRRAYFDDGTPLGSASSDECKIDSIAQSWSIISGAGHADRRVIAMASARKHLVDEDARLIRLLTPAFDKTPHDPGYIKGYLPGVRENGAQYTHAALWAVLATALEGDGDRAFALYQMINPFTHARTADEVETYKVEPYVVAADVYTAQGHLGRGGWTWYTGSASWMYRVGLEAILGFTKRGNSLTIKPRVPQAWPEISIEYRFGTSVYAITVADPHLVGVNGAVIQIDGKPAPGDAIALVDDGARREVTVQPRGA